MVPEGGVHDGSGDDQEQEDAKEGVFPVHLVSEVGVLPHVRPPVNGGIRANSHLLGHLALSIWVCERVVLSGFLFSEREISKNIESGPKVRFSQKRRPYCKRRNGERKGLIQCPRSGGGGEERKN